MTASFFPFIFFIHWWFLDSICLLSTDTQHLDFLRRLSEGGVPTFLSTLYIAVLYLPLLRHIYYEKDPYLIMVFPPHSLDIFQFRGTW